VTSDRVVGGTYTVSEHKKAYADDFVAKEMR